MKKYRYIIFGALLPLLFGTLSCSRDYMFINESFSGSVNHGNERGQIYMTTLAADLTIDHLLALEDALVLDALGFTTAREGGSFQPDGNSIWSAGARWSVSSVESLPGLRITKEAADSTWTLSFDGMYNLSGFSFPTTTQILARMLPGGNSNHHNWKTDISVSRTEDEGFSMTLNSVNSVEWGINSYSEFTYYSDDYSWEKCIGQFMMEVFLDKKLKDRALLTYSGRRSEYRYRNGL